MALTRPRPWHGASLRVRLMALAFVAIVPAMAAVLYTAHQINVLRRAEVSDMALRGARQAADELDRFFGGIESLLLTVSRVPLVREGDRPACNRYLGDLGPHLPHVVSLFLLDSAGHWMCGSVLPTSPEPSFEDRGYFRDALAREGVVVGTYTLDRVSGRHVLPVALAARSGGGAETGVLVATIDLAWLGRIMRERGVPASGSITVADREATIIAREPLSERFVGTRIPEPFHRLMQAAAPGVEEVTSQDGTKRVLGYVPLGPPPSGLYVSAGLSSDASFEAVSAAARRGAMMIAAGAIAALAATWLMGSRAFIRPLERLNGVLVRWRSGERDARTGLTADAGEIGALGMQLDALMDEIRATQAKRDLLARELSHRVKNTLATVQALAMATLNGPQPARDVLPDYLQRIKALAHMHDVLLRDHWDSATLAAAIEGVLTPLSPEPGRVRVSGEDCELPPQLALGMTMVLHELATNALKHGALSTPEGTVALSWTLDRTSADPVLTLEWRESGGPPVNPPASRSGFGMRLMSRAFGDAGTAQIDFDPDGVVCTVRVTLSPERQAAA